MQRCSKKIFVSLTVMLMLVVSAGVLFSAPRLRLTKPANPTIANYNSALPAAVNLSVDILHRNDAADIAFGIGPGNSLDPYARYANDNKGNQINYNIYNNLTDRFVVTDIIENGDITIDWYLADSYPQSGGWTTYTYTFTIEVPADQFPETSSNTTYTDTLPLILYSVSNGVYSVVDDSKSFSLSISVDTITQIAVGPTGFTGFTPGLGYNLDLLEIELNETAEFDTVVKSNAPYSIEVSSLYSGKLRQSADPGNAVEVIDYTFSLNDGPQLALDVPESVITDAPATVVEGERYGSIITITQLAPANTAGNYEDTISFTITAQ
jgi:spore coat protein U-like protein